mgnify:FL=1
MSDQKSILKSTILQYGLIYGGISVAFAIMLFVMKMHTEENSISSLVSALILAGSITAGQIAFRKLNNGYLNLSEAMKIGLGVTVIGLLIGILYFWFQSTILDPNSIDKLMDIEINATIDRFPEMTDEQIAAVSRSIEWWFSPIPLSAMLLAVGLIFGAIVSLITGLIVKKSRPN